MLALEGFQADKIEMLFEKSKQSEDQKDDQDDKP